VVSLNDLEDKTCEQTDDHEPPTKRSGKEKVMNAKTEAKMKIRKTKICNDNGEKHTVG
jgi:hypothetical protein